MVEETLTWREASDKIREKESFPRNYTIMGPRFSDSAENIGVLLSLRNMGYLPKNIRGDKYLRERINSLGSLFDNIPYIESDEGIIKPPKKILSESIETPAIPFGEVNLEILSQQYADKEKLWENYRDKPGKVNIVGSDLNSDMAIPISNLLRLYKEKGEPIKISNAPDRLVSKIGIMGLENILKCA